MSKEYYIRTTPVKGEKRTTICGVLVGNKLHIGISTCSTKDVFVKKIGRAIAKGRALKNPEVEYTLSKNEIPIEVFIKEAKSLCTDFMLGEISKPKEKQILETV